MNKAFTDQSTSFSSIQDRIYRGFKIPDTGQQEQLAGEIEQNYLFGLDDLSYPPYQPKQQENNTSLQQILVRQSFNSSLHQSGFAQHISKDTCLSQEEILANERFTTTGLKTKIVYSNNNQSLSKQLSKVSNMNDDKYNQEKIEINGPYYQTKSFAEGEPEKKLNEVEEFDKYGNRYVTPLIWRKNFFKLLLLTNRFKFNCKKVLLYFRPMELTEYQLSAINDRSAQTFQEALVQQSHSQELYKPKKRSKIEKKIRICYLNMKKQMKCVIVPIQNFIYHFYEIIYYLDKQIPLANPFNFIMLIWDFLIILFSILNLLFIPYVICFIEESTSNDKIINFIQRISYTIFIFDIIVSMNTSNYVKGELVKERIKVIKSYIKNQLIYDAICLGCLIFDKPFNYSILRMFFLLKMIKVGDLIEKNREFFQVDDKYSSLTNLILLMTKIMYLCHLFACYWYKIGRFVQSEGDTSWLDQFTGFEQNDNLYINAIYYAAITITTVGYGDITPKAKIEKIFIIVMAFISCANFGYALNQIGSIIQEFNSKKEQYRQNIAAINKYMKEREVNKLLQSKARKYFEYIYSQSENLNNQSDVVLSKLSSNLQLQIKKEVNLKTLKKIPFLFETFSKECLEKIAVRIQEKCYGIGESILDQQELSRPAIYLIIKGDVSVFLKDRQQLYSKTFKQLHQDDIFGEYQFFSQSYDSHFNVISTGITMIHFLQMEDLLQVLEEFPKEREKFCNYKDRVMVYNKIDDIKFSCYSCKSPGHLVDKCPYLMYKPRKDKVIFKFKKDQALFFKEYRRVNNKKYRTLTNMKDMQIQAQSFLDDLESEEGVSILELSQNQKQVCEQIAVADINTKKRQSNQKSKSQIEQGSSLTSFDGKLNQSQKILQQLQKDSTNFKISEEQVQTKQTIVQPMTANLLSDQKERQQENQHNRRSSKLKMEEILQNQQNQTTIINNNINYLKKDELQNSTSQQAQQIFLGQQNNQVSQQNLNTLFMTFFNEFKNVLHFQNKDQGRISIINNNDGIQANKKSNLCHDFGEKKQSSLQVTNINKKQEAKEDIQCSQNENFIDSNPYQTELGESCAMDSIKFFEFYFPHNNANKVLQDYYQKFHKSISLQREQNRKKKLQIKRQSKNFINKK